MENLSNRLVAPCPDHGVGVLRLSLGSRGQRWHSRALDPLWQQVPDLTLTLKSLILHVHLRLFQPYVDVSGEFGELRQQNEYRE